MTVSAEIRGDRILAVVPWMNGRGKDLAKAIPGHQPLWRNPDGSFTVKGQSGAKFAGWTYPLAWSTCVALRKTFGNDLKVGPRLTAWAWDEHRRNEQLEQLRAGNGASLTRVPTEAPGLYKALQNRPFQLTGTAFIAQSKRVILGDDPRLGKTYQALGAIIETGSETILVACPKTATRSVWAAKIREFTGEEAYVAQEDRANRELVLEQFAGATGRRWLVVNKEMIRVARRWVCKGDKDHRSTSAPTVSWCAEHGWEGRIKPGRRNGCQGRHEHRIVHHPVFPQIHGMTYDAIVLDECHHALASQSNKQSDNISQIRLGAVKLKLTDDGLKLGLSGTPFRSRLTNSWGTLNWCRPDVFTSFWNFAAEHFGVDQGGYGGSYRILRDTPIDDEAFITALRPYYLARTKAEVAPQLPPIDHVDVSLEMTSKQAKAYYDMKEDAKARLENGEILANGVLAELTRLRQFASAWGKMSAGTFVPNRDSNKLEWVLQFLEEREAQNGKVVIATGFTKLAKLFAEEIRAKGWKVLMITGDTTGRQRDQAQDEFQNGSTRVIVINMFAGGEAIDLSAADELVALDDPWNDDTRQQYENRIVNLSKTNQLTIFHLRSEGTVESDIAEMNDAQRAALMSAKPKALKDVLA